MPVPLRTQKPAAYSRIVFDCRNARDKKREDRAELGGSRLNSNRSCFQRPNFCLSSPNLVVRLKQALLRPVGGEYLEGRSSDIPRKWNRCKPKLQFLSLRTGSLEPEGRSYVFCSSAAPAVGGRTMKRNFRKTRAPASSFSRRPAGAAPRSATGRLRKCAKLADIAPSRARQ